MYSIKQIHPECHGKGGRGRYQIGVRCHRLLRLTGAVLAASGLSIPVAQAATEFELAGMKGSVKTDVTFGTQIRGTSTDPELVNNANAVTVGASGNRAGGTARNNDDGNLNYKQGDVTSTVVKALIDSSLKGETFEGVLKAKVWYDYTLSQHGVPFGNAINGYASGQPLGQSGADPLAKSSGVSVQEAYVKAKLRFDATQGDVALGSQTLTGWGERFAFSGGVSGVLARDFAAAMRPGALPGEISVPIPMVQLKLGSPGVGNFEFFYQLGRAENAVPLCGTLGAPADFLATGCNKAYVGPGSDASRDAAGQFLKRDPDQHFSNSSQYGVAYRFKVESLNTQFSLNYATHNSRIAVVSAVQSRNGVNPLVNGDPAGTNVKYYLEYPDDIHVFGLGFTSQLSKATTLVGEISRRTNQPIALNGPDILNAFASYVAPTPLRTNAQAVAGGQFFHGYDRFTVNQMQLGVSHGFGSVVGAQDVTVYGEVGLRHVEDLPDVNVRRYGRPTMLGMGPVAGVCQGGSTTGSAQCNNDGYVTSNAWGYRVRTTGRYPNVFTKTDLIPTIGFGQDVKGYSDDGVFSEGRRLLNLSLKALYDKKYWMDVTLQSARGGAYNPIRDREFINLSIGASF